MTVLVPGKDDHAAIMAGIGHICVQWASLETILLAIIGAIENMPPKEYYIVFGGLDMRPRLGMAITLAEYHKIHPRLINRLRTLRTKMDKAKIADRRNQAVHGAHTDSDIPEHVQLTMVRLKGDRQTEAISVADLRDLGFEILALADEAISIFRDFGVWKFGEHRPENNVRQFVATSPSLWLKIKQYVSTRINHLRGNL